MDFAKEQILKRGYRISNYFDEGQTFQIYTEKGGIDYEQLSKGLSYLKYALSKGIPVIVGVDNKSGHPGNLDKSTDHFIVIVGMGTDVKGKYFLFFDNASGSVSQGASNENKLYYNASNSKITGKTQCFSYRNCCTKYDYIITQIRKSK